MAIQIPLGGGQEILVYVRDTTGLITTLAGSSPTYDIYAVDGDTDLNTTQVVTGATATVDGLTVICEVNTVYNPNLSGTIGSGVATNAPTLTLPITVVAGVNDQYNIPTIFYGNQVLNPGTYTTMAAVAQAMSDASGQFDGGYSYSYALDEVLGAFTWDASANRMRFAMFSIDPAYNGYVIRNGTHDFLSGTGWVNNQVFISGAVSPGRLLVSPELTPGKYRLYVNFSSGLFETPRIGPVEFFVV